MTAIGLGIIAALCWGLHDITVRYLSRTTPLMAALLFVLIAGLIFQYGLIWFNGAALTVSHRAFWLSVGSGCAFLVASLGLYFAFARGPVRLVSPIIGAFPVLTLIYATLSGATLALAQILAVLGVMIGVGLVAALSDARQDTSPPKGPTILISLLSAIGFATTFKLGHMAAEIDGELVSTFIARATAAALLIPLMLARREPFFPGQKVLPLLGAMGLLDGIALLSVISAATLPNAEFAAVGASMFGLLTILLAWSLLRETMTRAQWAGCLIAFLCLGYLAL